MPQMASFKAIVEGHVQGVYFRAYVSRAAKALGLKGYVRNLPSGKVEVKAEGDKEKLENLVKQMEIGPPEAVVEKLEISWSDYTGLFATFEIRY